VQPSGRPRVAATGADLFGQLFERREVDCNAEGPDQLTRELHEFVASVRGGAPVRVTGAQGRDALAVACRILDAIARHSWDGVSGGRVGPTDLPPPLGPLFPVAGREAA